IGITVDKNGTRAYVTNHGDNTVTVIDTASQQPVGSPIPVGQHPTSVATSADGGRAYVTNRTDGTVTVIDTASQEPVGSPIPVGKHPIGITVDKNGTRAYVTNHGDNTVTVIDTASQQTVGSPVEVGESPAGITVTTAGERVYVANNGGGSVTEIDTATNQRVQEIPLDHGPYGAVLSAGGERLAVSRTQADDAVFLDAAIQEGRQIGLRSEHSFRYAIGSDNPALGTVPAMHGGPSRASATHLVDLDDGTIAFRWANGQYVSQHQGGSDTTDGYLGLDHKLTRNGKFIRVDLGEGKFALLAQQRIAPCRTDATDPELPVPTHLSEMTEGRGCFVSSRNLNAPAGRGSLAANAPGVGPTETFTAADFQALPPEPGKSTFLSGTRSADGMWTSPKPLGGAGGQGEFRGVSPGLATTPNGETHYVGITDGAAIMHRIKSGNSMTNWQALPGLPSGTPQSISVAALPNGETQYLAISSHPTHPTLWHNLRQQNGEWQGWESVDTSPFPGGHFMQTAITGMPNGDSQIMVQGMMGLTHRVRHADGSWGNWSLVGGWPGVSANSPAIVGLPNGESRAFGLNADGRLWHRVRHADGTWGSITEPAGIPQAISVSASASPDGTIHILLADLDGGVRHVVLHPDGRWDPPKRPNGYLGMPTLTANRPAVTAGSGSGSIEILTDHRP
ncbi:hypothetical protein AB0D08_40500, partial [Kitasatospora sp. NPDC048540]